MTYVRKHKYEKKHRGEKVPLSTFVADAAGAFFGYKTKNTGTIYDIEVDLKGVEGEDVGLRLVIEHMTRHTEESKLIKAKAGANSLGTFKVEARDRIRLELINGQAKEVFITASFVAS